MIEVQGFESEGRLNKSQTQTDNNRVVHRGKNAQAKGEESNEIACTQT